MKTLQSKRGRRVICVLRRPAKPRFFYLAEVNFRVAEYRTVSSLIFEILRHYQAEQNPYNYF